MERLGALVRLEGPAVATFSSSGPISRNSLEPRKSQQEQHRASCEGKGRECIVKGPLIRMEGEGVKEGQGLLFQKAEKENTNNNQIQDMENVGENKHILIFEHHCIIVLSSYLRRFGATAC